MRRPDPVGALEIRGSNERPGTGIAAPVVPPGDETPDGSKGQQVGQDQQPAPRRQIRPLVFEVRPEEEDPTRELAALDPPERVGPLQAMLVKIVVEGPGHSVDGTDGPVGRGTERRRRGLELAVRDQTGRQTTDRLRQPISLSPIDHSLVSSMIRPFVVERERV